MSIIPCQTNAELRALIEDLAETLKTQAHTLGQHALDERDFYDSGLFRGAIERIRGQFSAAMAEKRQFVAHVLNRLQDENLIDEWESSGDANRHDYTIALHDRRTAVIELKGCLDGNNTNIFERPPHAHEFIIWSVCTNPGADPRHNAWSGIHTRLSAEIIANSKVVDGVVIWDMVCATMGRRCPKVEGRTDRLTEVGPYLLPPPCLYLLPRTIPSPRNNPNPSAQRLDDVRLLYLLHQLFRGEPDEVNYVDFAVEHRGAETLRTTTIRRGGAVVKRSKPTAIRRA